MQNLEEVYGGAHTNYCNNKAWNRHFISKMLISNNGS